MTITQFHRDNLKILADYLTVMVPPPGFHMATFLGNPDHYPFKFPETMELYNECGTVACAVGHGPLAGMSIEGFNDWSDYSMHFFGCSMYFHSGAAAFIWMFGGSWADKDNTPKGAATRINWFLEHGVPADYRDQMSRPSYPLCYTVTE